MIPYIINTLNQIEVKGKDNMDKLLGAIMALESMLDAENQRRQEQAEKMQESTSEGE